MVQAGRMRWPVSVPELPPAPEGGSLVLEVACGAGDAGDRHPVTIDPDWAVRTPHDLARARLDVGLGQHHPCVDLVDRTVPALRDLMQLVARRRLPPLARNHAGRWVVTEPTAGCGCAQESFDTVQAAAAHVRTAAHLAPRYAADAAVLATLAAASEAAHGGFTSCPPEGWTALACIREPRGLDALWDAGVPPELVLDVQDRVLPRGAPLPAQAYLGAAFHCPDPDWLAATVARRPEPEVVVWAAWGYGEGDRTQPRLRGQWLARGLPRSTVGVLVDGGITVRLARELAEATGRSVREAAEVLAAWERAGCRPGPGDIAALDAAGQGGYRPVPGLVSALHRRSERLATRPTRTQVAVALGLAGSRQEAWRLLREEPAGTAAPPAAPAPARTAEPGGRG